MRGGENKERTSTEDMTLAYWLFCDVVYMHIKRGLFADGFGGEEVVPQLGAADLAHGGFAFA